MYNFENATSGNSFIDENHNSLLTQLERLTDLVRNEWIAESFHMTFSSFVSSLEAHFSHEETVLKGANFKELETHKIKHRELSLQLRMKNMGNLDYDDAVQLLVYTRSAVFSHELLDDQKYWDVFDENASNLDLDSGWSNDLLTGEKEADLHHQALIKFIQRLDTMFINSEDYIKAAQELKLLKNYSQLHFDTEKKMLGEGLRILHELNHKDQLNDLEVLIKEVEAGKYNLANLADYLRYWLINHIKNFDVPEFRNKHL